MRDKESSAAEISAMVGFQSITTFYKAFKRIYGVASYSLEGKPQRVDLFIGLNAHFDFEMGVFLF